MKAAVFLLSLVLASGAFFIYKPAQGAKILEAAADMSSHAFYDKEIRYAGLYRLSQDDIAKMLPTQSSWTWWLANLDSLGASLETSPLIKAANVSRCGFFSLRCFNVQIEERNPGMLAIVGDKVWMIGRDGAFITPVPGRASSNVDKRGMWTRRFYSEEWKALPVVDGVFFDSASPEAVRARVGYVKEALDEIEDASGMIIEGAKVRDNGEIVVKFDRHNFQVVFDAGSEARDLSRLIEEAGRLKRILAEIRGREEQVPLIDLGFESLAVVKVPGLEKLVDKTPGKKK